jgi:hypothetical protein
MGPSNENELAIARIVDKIEIEGKLHPTAIKDVILALHFSPSGSDHEFLVDYISWRMEHPIWK